MAEGYAPPQGARTEAQRGLDWRSEYGRGGTAVGIARARDIANGASLSADTIRRMVSFFARHEVDKQGTGWSPGEDGYPSNGRIAWALWGGDAGRAWAEKIDRRLDSAEAKKAGSTMPPMLCAFDIDGTVDAFPAQFLAIMQALRCAGHSVVVLTGSSDDVTPEVVAHKAQYLNELGLGDAYDRLVVLPRPHVENKVAWCQAHNVEVLFDNRKETARALAETGTTLALVPWQTRV